MRKSRFTTEQIIGYIKQVGAGTPVADLCRQCGFSGGTFYKWRATHGGMDVPDARRPIWRGHRKLHGGRDTIFNQWHLWY